MTRRVGAFLLAAAITVASGLLAAEERSTRNSGAMRRVSIQRPGPTAQEEGDTSIQSPPFFRPISPRASANRLRTTTPAAKATARITKTTRSATTHRAETLTRKDRSSTNGEVTNSPGSGPGSPSGRGSDESLPAPVSLPSEPAPSGETAPAAAIPPPAPVLTAPVLLTRTAVYPDEAARIILDRSLMTPELRIAASEGRVTLKVLVREDGSVGEVQILSSSGNPVLDRAAVAAAAAWRFQPATRDGVPIAAWAIVPVRFIIP